MRTELFEKIKAVSAQVEALKSVVQNPPAVSITEDSEDIWDDQISQAIDELRGLKSEVSEYLFHYIYKFKTARRIIPQIQARLLEQESLPAGIKLLAIEEKEVQEALLSAEPEIAEEATFCLRKGEMDQELSKRYSYFICLNVYIDGSSAVSVSPIGKVVVHKGWAYQFYRC